MYLNFNLTMGIFLLCLCVANVIINVLSKNWEAVLGWTVAVDRKNYKTKKPVYSNRRVKEKVQN